MGNFKDFRSRVTAIFPEDKRKDIYFSQIKDGYGAAYKPLFPESSQNDIIINSIYNSGAYLRGNYELIHAKGGAAHVHYANSIEELKTHI